MIHDFLSDTTVPLFLTVLFQQPNLNLLTMNNYFPIKFTFLKKSGAVNVNS